MERQARRALGSAKLRELSAKNSLTKTTFGWFFYAQNRKEKGARWLKVGEYGVKWWLEAGSKRNYE